MGSDRDLDEAQIIAIALRVARRAGDPHPSAIQYASGPRSQTTLIMSGGSFVDDDSPTCVIAITGSFSGPSPSGPGRRDQVPLSWPVQLVAVDPHSGRVLDSAGAQEIPDMSGLRDVRTLKPRLSQLRAEAE